jgi:hypothetical protein
VANGKPSRSRFSRRLLDGHDGSVGGKDSHFAALCNVPGALILAMNKVVPLVPESKKAFHRCMMRDVVQVGPQVLILESLPFGGEAAFE